MMFNSKDLYLRSLIFPLSQRNIIDRLTGSLFFHGGCPFTTAAPTTPEHYRLLAIFKFTRTRTGTLLLTASMPNPSAPALRALSERTAAWTRRAYVPFSQKPVAAVLVTKNGDWVPGVRVESASYSLAIPALLNAYTTLMTIHAEPIVAISLSRPLRPEEIVFSESICGGPLVPADDCVLLARREAPLPDLRETPVDPLLPFDAPSTPAEGIALARRLARRAFVPESQFPVAAILESESGELVPGVNVENENWANILCAERNAVGTAVTYGVAPLKNLYLTCSNDDACSPCGACRQLLTELTPSIRLWMDRGSNPEQPSTPDSLLPASFMGQTLFNK